MLDEAAWRCAVETMWWMKLWAHMMTVLLICVTWKRRREQGKGLFSVLGYNYILQASRDTGEDWEDGHMIEVLRIHIAAWDCDKDTASREIHDKEGEDGTKAERHTQCPTRLSLLVMGVVVVVIIVVVVITVVVVIAVVNFAALKKSSLKCTPKHREPAPSLSSIPEESE